MTRLLSLLLGMCFSLSAHTGVLWQANSLSLLSGKRYQIDYTASSDDHQRTVVTLEHVSEHSWGDLFSFVDLMYSGDDQQSEYWEFSPRLSLSKMSSFLLNTFAPLNDVLLVSTLEVSRFDSDFDDNQFINVLYGIGFDWQVAGFDVMQTNIYYADNQDQDNDYQLTLVWSTKFGLADSQWLYDGFIDWSSTTATHRASFNATSQLKWDLGASLFQKPKKLYLGVEYVYWNNKFGIKNGVASFSSNERNINFLIKYYL